MQNVKSRIMKGLAANRDIAVVALFLLAYLLFFLFNDLSYALGIPHDIYFSEAVFEGIDVGKRANSFFGIALVAVVLYFILYSIVHFLFRRIRLKSRQTQTLMILSISGFFSVFSTLIGWNASLLSDTLLIILFLKLTLYTLANHKKGPFPILGTDIFSNIGLSLAVIFYFAFVFLFNSHAFARENFLLWFLVIFAIINLTLSLFKHFTGISNRRIFFLLAPFGFIPIFAFIAGEAAVFFKLQYDLLIRFKYIFIALTTLGLVIFGAFIYFNKSRTSLSGKKLLEWFLLPSVLLCLIILAYYNPFPQQSTEIFELANPANSMLRFFAHRQIPFIDYMSSHMISEQWYGMIYHAIFGFDSSLDYRVYEFFNMIVIAFVIYFFLHHLFGRKELALLFMVSFPFIFTIFFIHIIMAVLLYHISIRAVEKQTTVNFLLLFLTIILLFIWRLDTGSASLLTFLFFTPLLYIIHRKKPRWMIIMKAGVIMALIIAASVIVSMIWRSPEYITGNFFAALNYVRSNLAHGYHRLAWSHPHQFFIYHYFFPLLSLASIVVTVTLLRRGPVSISSTKHTPALSSVFFLILYLANMQRGLVRHSFLSGSEMFLASTLFVGLALFITFLIEQSQKNANRYLVFFSSAFLVFALLKFFPLGTHETLVQSALDKPSYAQFDLNFNDIPLRQRTLPNNSFQELMYKDLKIFLDSNLTSDQSFLDFSNTPMLYYYCERRIPGYFNQNLQNTVNDYLQLHLLKQVDPQEIPVVVFSNIPHNWFDATDGVPNVMRYYMIAEYIFEHYEPYGIISNKSIWVAKGLDFDFEPVAEDHYIHQTHVFHYKKSAHYAGQYHHHHKPGHFEPVWRWQAPDEFLMGKVSVELPELTQNIKNGWLHIMIDSDHHQDDVWLHLLKDDQVIGKYTFHALKGKRYYLLRPGNHYKWMDQGADRLELEIRDRMFLKGINILKDNRIENRNTDIY